MNETEDFQNLLTELKGYLQNTQIKSLIKEVIEQEILLAREIKESYPQLAIGDILPKIDDIVSRIWDWIKQRKKESK